MVDWHRSVDLPISSGTEPDPKFNDDLCAELEQEDTANNYLCKLFGRVR